ncbi:amidohydrolase family protein [Brevibacterium album]|uniref:amidohydrolase family protein n=1 Tax=Brevibacterium album TaxID=417948 RepID=UPI000425507C|nr:amidohydrolase family protein [Brevibacterium album]
MTPAQHSPHTAGAAQSGTLLIRNVRPWGGGARDILIEDGRIASLTPVGEGSARVSVPEIDGRGLLAVPGLVNAHAHVDKSWWGLPWESFGGEPGTDGRIRHERAERDRLGIPGADITRTVLERMVASGTTAIRSHVDVDLGLGQRGIETVREAAAGFGGALEVQIVAFPQDGVLRRPGVMSLLRDAVQAGTESIGGLDPATIDRDPVGQIDGIMEIAGEFSAGVDVHLHDPADLGVFQIELMCERVERHGLQGLVNIAHGFAVAQVDAARRRDLLARMGELGMSMTTVAPPRLGAQQLPMRELEKAGVRLGLGTDGIRDLWSPYGTGDVMGIAWQFARAGGWVRDEDLTQVVRLASSDGAWAVGRDDHDLVVGGRGDVVLVDAENPMDLLVRGPQRELVVGAGRILHQRDGR